MSKKLVATLGLLSASLFAGEVANAQQAGDLLVRGRVLYVAPDASATTTIGGTADIDSKVVPEIDFTYFIADNIGLELIAATTKHNATAIGTDVGDVPLGSAWLLPPTLSLQYHMPMSETLKPYFGAGVNYTFFYSEEAAGTPVNDFNLNDTFGFSLQAGVDIELNESMFLNVDVKKLFLSTDATIPTDLGLVTADVQIDPWIIGVGIGTKF
ncbi:OmpW/AlkL family protein [Pseudemcibacter aquimaris]|uniref:OmpW/AlkL family protein n=1 Tax=Pseudemcibacter aquimaris TaxID=2857064 RepID=UPI0020116FD1|nr:OmpW family outer membrane protein [Pseudemcibacter aquimaris]MCC3860411.1 outer membrane beta-barrel protein [Pseudemcibacter aquimaris]WDU57737.1 outer membrane beta-barrel protein [Pseudemcibacter aquimaris]